MIGFEVRSGMFSADKASLSTNEVQAMMKPNVRNKIDRLGIRARDRLCFARLGLDTLLFVHMSFSYGK